MNRLQKQCVIASAGMHLLLVVALLFGSGFRSKQHEPLDIQPFHMMPSSVLESLLDDPADVADVADEPEPKPEVEPPVESEKIIEPEPATIEPEPEPVVTPKPEPKPDPVKEPAISKRIEKPKPKVVKPKIKISKQFKTNTSSRKPKVNTQKPKISRPSTTTVKLNQNLLKVGGGSKIKGVTTISGSSLGRYGHLVQSAYDREWTQPTSISGRNLTVKIKVIVSRDGSIQSANISQSSGVAAMDQSIERAIRKVRRISQAPPQGASLGDRTFIINFNLKS